MDAAFLNRTPSPVSMTSSLVPSAKRYFSRKVWGMVVWPFLVTTTVVKCAHRKERTGSNKGFGTTETVVLLHQRQIICLAELNSELLMFQVCQ